MNWAMPLKFNLLWGDLPFQAKLRDKRAGGIS